MRDDQVSPGDADPRIAELSPAKRALLERALLRRRRAEAGPAGIARRTGSGPWPLSFAQQRLWFLAQLDPGSAAYNIPAALRLRGRLDVPALRGALDLIAARHATLRACFALGDDGPVQEVRPAEPVDLPAIDLGGLAPGERERALEERLREEARRPFDLTRDLLIRAALLSLGPDDHVLFVNMHHIAADGWSLGVFLGELATAYAALARGERPGLAELAIRYTDYAIWQREWMSGARLDGELAYWRAQLAGAPPTLPLPADRAPGATRSGQGARIALDLPVSLPSALRALGRTEGASLFMVLLASVYTLLGRYSGQHDIVVGSPIAGRDRTETQGLIGLLLNVLCLRADLSGNPTFRELLTRVRATALSAYEHQALPFEKLVEELHPERSLAQAPIAQVVFNLLEFEDRVPELPGLDVARVFVDPGTVNYDLSLAAYVDRGGLRAVLRYSTDLFTAPTAERMLGHWVTLLEGIAADPDRRLADLPLLTGAERRQAIAEWNPPPPPEAAATACIHRLVEAQAARRPEAVAVTLGAERLTYGDLNARANRLARALRRAGVGPDVLVGICVEPSLDLIVGLLGILKAGGAYVPVDPAYPPERLAFMLDDANVMALLTQRAHVGRLPAGRAPVICLDDALEAGDSGEDLGVRVELQNLAYVIYTSGSSGRPKGVLVTHANVSRLFTATRAWFEFGETDVWTLFHSSAFDFSVWEMWGALIHGGRLVVVPYLTGRSPEAFHELLRAEGVTVLNQTPSAFRQLVPVAAAGAGASALRAVVFGGEALDLRSLVPWVERHGDRAPRLINMYGITETTVHVTYRPLEAEEIRQADGSRIGGPIPDLQVYLLDGGLEPVPIGVPGELFVGGPGLARGYLNQPGLTAERFIPDPFGPAPGGRLYRTGDLGRRLPGGDIEYLGRADQQVKIRGFRIELGEIEGALVRHPAVRDAVAAVREDVPGDARLVAYVVVSGEPPSADLLREFLRRSLPEYMIPGSVVALEALPLTRNGKLDRRALPAPATDRAAVRPAAAPRDALELGLAQIWETVLGVRPVGIHDSFFDLGGHSLLAVRLAREIGKLTGSSVPLVTVFRAPTVAEMAAAVRGTTAAEERGPERSPAGPSGPAPLSFAQQRLWFLDQLEPDSTAYSIPAALRIAGPLRVDLVRRALEIIVARHETLRTTFKLVDGSPLQMVNPPGELELPVLDLSGSPDPEAGLQEALGDHLRRPFDLTRDPMLRTALFVMGADDHVLFLSMHHIASDAWSFGVFFRELSAAYDALSRRAEPVLPPLSMQYREYAAWQREWLQGPRLQQHLDYWRGTLAGAPAVIDLPTDHPRREPRSWQGARVVAELSAELVEGLREVARREKATLFMVLLAGFQALLCRYSGQQDVVVGSPIAGRDRPEAEGLIGLFLNALCLRADLSGNPTFRELLTRVRAAAVSAYSHQALPFERLVEELQPDRALGHSPIFQTFFNLLELEDRLPVIPGLAVSRIPMEVATAKYDLGLSVVRTGTRFDAALRYPTDLFTAATAERMLTHWIGLLGTMVAEPDRRLADVPLLTPAEGRRRTLQLQRVRPRNSGTRFPRAALDDSIGQRFEEQVRRHGARIAVRSQRHTWTYEQLDRAVNRVARALLARLGPGEGRVALLLGHDAPMIAALLGALRAGKTYVPLDPTYPSDRLAYMLADAEAAALVTERAHAPMARGMAREGLAVISVDELPGGVGEDDPGVKVSPETLAYLLYTSGSTGRPKGVMQSHRNVLHHVRVYGNTLGITPEDRLTLFPSYAFDAAVMDIFGALLNGASLHPWSVKDQGLAGIQSWLREGGHTVFHSTPTLYRHFVATLATGDVLPSVRRVVMGGEEVQRRDVEAFRRHFPPPCIFVNGMGPTESTLALQCFIDHDTELTGARVPVGDPVEDMDVLLLDPDGRPAVMGEIAFRSSYIALGYWRQPDLTRAAFLDDPAGGDRRIYRTGDLGRRRPDGAIEFIGRRDFQIKVRGFRIEPGEIETLLRRHEAIREAVVVAREDRPGDTRLVAYVSPHVPGGSVPPAAELRRMLQAELPDYMIPAAFVALDALPLTPTGKIDRLALPAPARDHASAGAAGAAPRDALEGKLAAIWASTLGVPTVGIHDSFFDLGGHSLLAVRLFAEVAKVASRPLPLATIFHAPTVAALADILRDDAPAAGTPRLVPLQPLGTRAPLFCVHQHSGHLFCYRALVGHLGTDQPAFGLAPPGLDGIETPLDRIETIAAHYVRAIRTQQPHGPYHLVGYCFGGVIAFEMAHQLLALGEPVGLLAFIETAWRAPMTRGQRWLVRSRRRLAYELDLLGKRPAIERAPFAVVRAGALVAESLGRTLRFRAPEADEADEQTTFLDAAIERVAKAHTAARRRYVPRVYPGRIVLFRPETLSALHFGDPDYGWGPWARDGIDLRAIPASTPTLVDEPAVQILAEHLRRELDGKA